MNQAPGRKKTGMIIMYSLLILAVLTFFAFRFEKQKRAYLRELQRSGVQSPSSLTAADSIDLVFNYVFNHQPFQATIIDIGEPGHPESELMDSVLVKIKMKFNNALKIVHYGAHDQGKIQGHFAVKQVPSLIMLDRHSTQCYRRSGYIAYDDLRKEVERVINQK